MISDNVSLFIALLAGTLTFFSPCVLPLIPIYLSLITGFSVDELMNADQKKILLLYTFIRSVLFVLGFSLVFIAFGVSVSFISKIFINVQDILRIFGGIVIIFFGLLIGGFLRIDFLNRTLKINIQNRSLGYFGAFLVGAAFSFGWTPCVGPILSSILIVAGTKHSVVQGFLLLSAYSIGLGLPIIISAVAFNYLLTFFRFIKKYINLISLISGIFLIILGLLVLTDNFSYLMNIISWGFKF